MFKLSPKQQDVLRNFKTDFTYMILVGASATGKSFIVNLGWYTFLCGLKPKEQVMILGNTSDSIYKNIVNELLKIDENIGWLSRPKANMIITKTDAICHIVGVNNEGSDKKLQGGSLEAIYADEVTTYPRSSFDMASSRLRGEGKNGKLKIKPMILTLNPDDDDHYLKKNLIDKIDNKTLLYNFTFQDNPAVTQDFVEQFGQKFAGEFYERMILGKWSNRSERLIMKEFDETRNVEDFVLPSSYIITSALDVGWSAKSAYILGTYDYVNNRVLIFDEWSDTNALTSDIHEKVTQLESNYNTKKITRWSDTDQRLVHDLSANYSLQFNVTRKDNKQLQINNVNVALREGRLVIHPRCKDTIEQIKTGKWDKHGDDYEKDSSGGHLDLLDAVLYFYRNVDKRNPYPAIPDGISIHTHHIPDYENIKNRNLNGNNSKTIESLKAMMGNDE